MLFYKSIPTTTSFVERRTFDWRSEGQPLPTGAVPMGVITKDVDGKVRELHLPIDIWPSEEELYGDVLTTAREYVNS